MSNENIFNTGKKTIILPVNPEELKISEKSKNREQVVLGIGDVNIPDVRSLNEIEIKSFFPAKWAEYCSVGTQELLKPIEYVNQIMGYKNSKQPIQIIFAGNLQEIIKKNGNTSGLFLVEDLDWEIKAGEEADIYYTISFKQYRNYEPRKVTLKQATPVAKQQVIKQPEKRPIAIGVDRVKKRTYIVKSGDNLWNIARSFYGDGALYGKIATANNIKNPSLIYPGQVLVIS